MKEFDEIWDAGLPQEKMPLSKEELSRMICNAQQSALQTQMPTPQRTWRRKWAVAASVVLLFTVGTTLLLIENRAVPTVKVQGQQIHFVCNNGCSPESTLQQLNDYIGEF